MGSGLRSPQTCVGITTCSSCGWTAATGGSSPRSRAQTGSHAGGPSAAPTRQEPSAGTEGSAAREWIICVAAPLRLLPRKLLVSVARKERKVVARQVLKYGKPANAGDLGLGQNGLAPALLDTREVGFNVLALDVKQNIARLGGEVHLREIPDRAEAAAYRPAGEGRVQHLGEFLRFPAK